MKDSFIKIEPFMIKALGLGGCELLTFAIIHGFTQSSGSYVGGYKYMMKEFGLAKTSIYYSLNHLRATGLISIEKDGNSLEIVSNIDNSKVQELNRKSSKAEPRKSSKIEPQGFQNGTARVPKLNQNGSKIEPKNIKKTNKTASCSYARGENPRPRAEPERLDVKGSMIDISDYSLPFEF